MKKWIQSFLEPKKHRSLGKDSLGNKGFGLVDMMSLGVNVPPGFVITTELCKYFYQNNHTLPSDFEEELLYNIGLLEKVTGKKFGDSYNPLLLSVRSGSKVSMPGMMDTILNIGITKDIIGKETNLKKAQFFYDCLRRFCIMYGSVVCNTEEELLLKNIDRLLLSHNVSNINICSLEVLKIIANHHYNLLGDDSNITPYSYLIKSIKSVLLSWNNDRAVIYRKRNNIDDNAGTAIIIQSMVFGNKNEQSLTGVMFSRNPSTGEKSLFGEYIIGAQGEDIVSGARTPKNLSGDSNDTIEKYWPSLYSELIDIASFLENHYKDAQDIEFTVEDGKLYILQTRNAKRSIEASIKIAVDMVKENLISRNEAVSRIDTSQLKQLFCSNINYNKANINIIGEGLPASPGCASGVVVFNSKDAEKLSQHQAVILVRNETTPEDISGMYSANGILTQRGGMTSHAAVVARGIGKPCVCGASNIIIDLNNKYIICGDHKISEGEYITIDGSKGNIILGKTDLLYSSLKNEFYEIIDWANSIKRMEVRVNAEIVEDIKRGLDFGAESIGLVRTEHMFFEATKLSILQQTILSNDVDSRKNLLDKLLPLHKLDFNLIFQCIKNNKVSIRLLDPPLHEFLPSKKNDLGVLAKSMNITESYLNDLISNLSETNPMLGIRGSRLGINFPEIYIMQVKAIILAYIEHNKENSLSPMLEIMLPLVVSEKELLYLKNIINNVISKLQEEHKVSINYKLGVMIETPRAAIQADKLANHVDYFSFGTNDLTQTTCAISRDDCSALIKHYIRKSIFIEDPFVKIDKDGVGYLMSMAIDKGRLVNSNIKIGVCGEHAGNPDSIIFFDELLLDYISCSPYNVPIAIITAAQSTIKKTRK